MMSGILSAELSATCNALGYSTGTTYHTDPYVKETITDLIRYLRRDEEDHSIRRHLGKAKILQTDLLPILIHHSDKEELFDVLLRLLVNLTNPALLIYQEELPGDRTSRHYFMQIISHLQSYKEAFTQQRVWEVLAGKLETLLNVPYQERDEDQSRMMERILILARNVLQVPADAEGEKRPDNDASVHDQVLWCLHQAGMVDLFLYIASTDREQQYYMHILEIVSLMLREQNPASLASAALQRSVEEKERDEKELLELRRRETLEKQSKMKKYAGSRHSRFGGTFVMKDVKSISDKDLIYHKPLIKAVSLSLDFEKQRARVPKNKVALSYHPSERRSAFSVRLFLKEFCVEFLNGAYNSLMYKVRENLVRAVSQPNDETYYFWAMKFFMEFNRLYKFQVKLVSETMHQQIFHFVQTQIENWLEMMITDKKNIPVWSRRVHQALKAYQELLMTLQEMDRSPEESVRRSATVIKSNVFYQSEYRELVIFLFNVYTEMKFSRAYLKDLVETTHIFMKMLEQFCKRHQNLVVLGKPKRKAVKKKKPAKSRPGQVDLEALWDGVGPELSAVLQAGAGIPSDVVPFDATSGRSMDEEKVEAMKRIKAEMMQSNFEQAVGLLRSSREVWPENDCFGRADMPPEEEFMAMREIFMADIGQLPEVAAPQEENEDENEADDEEEGDEQDIVIPESVFKFSEFVGRIACPKVLAPVCLLLDSFEQNSAFTNKCIVKLLHRVAMNCKLPQMLFQGTVFQTFQRAFKSTNPDHKELARLGNFIVREFVRMAKTNNNIYMELLFWKNNKEAYELEYGYGSSETKSHSAKNVWREEQEDELRRLAQEYEEKTPEDEPDAVDWIMKNMINQSRSRKAVIKKLKELYLVVGNMKPKKSKEMIEEEISQLKSLYEEYKDSSDPMNCILGRLSVQRGRNIITNKLLELGLISDRKELRKKRAKKSGNSGKELKWGDRSDDESIYDSWSDDNGSPSTSAPKEKKKKKAIKSRVGQPSVPQMCCNLKKVIDAGEELREALEWLQSSLQEVWDDLPDAEDDDEGTALLPLTPSCVQATDNPTFMQLMDILSIHKPTDQERYWRIPGTWKAEDLSTRINLIKNALDGKLPDINPDEVEESVKLRGIPLNKPKVVKNNKPRKKVKNALEQSVRESGDSASEDASQLSLHSNLDGNESRQQRKISSGDSSSDDNGIGLFEPSTSKQGKMINKRKLGLLKIDSDKESTDGSKSGTSKPSDSDDEIRNAFSNFKSVTNEHKLKRKKLSIESDSEDNANISVNTMKSSAPQNEMSSTNVRNKRTSNGEKNNPRIEKYPDENIDELFDSERTEIIVWSQESDISSKTEKIDVKDDSERTEIIVWSQESDMNSNSDSIPATIDLSSQESDMKSKSIDLIVVKNKRPAVRSVSHDSVPATIDMTSQESDMSSKTFDKMDVKRKRLTVESDSDDYVPITIDLSSQESDLIDVLSQESNMSTIFYKTAGNRKKLTVESDSDDYVPTTIVVSSQESNTSSKTVGLSDVIKKRLIDKSDFDDNNDSILNSTETSSSTQKTNEGLKDSSSIQKKKEWLYGFGISSGEFSNLDAPPREYNLDSEICQGCIGSISQGSNINLNKRKRRSFKSESDEETKNSTETMKVSQNNDESSLNQNKSVDDYVPITIDLSSQESDLIDVLSQESNMSTIFYKTAGNRKKLTVESDSDDYVPTTIVVSSQESNTSSKTVGLSDVIKKRLIDKSDFDDNNDSILNSTETSSSTQKTNEGLKDSSSIQKKKEWLYGFGISSGEFSNLDAPPREYNLDSEICQGCIGSISQGSNINLNKRKRRSFKSESDEETKNSTETMKVSQNNDESSLNQNKSVDDYVPITIDLSSQESDLIDVLSQESNMSTIFYKTAGNRKKLTVESDSDDYVPTAIVVSSQESNTSSKTVGLSDVRKKRLIDKSDFDDNNDSILNSTETSSSTQKTNEGLKDSSSIQKKKE